MAVYIDDAMIRYHNMLMNHMAADTTEELLDMARSIGVPVKWIQKAGQPYEHFDICAAKRSLAIKKGAIPVGQLEFVRILKEKVSPTKGKPLLKR